MESANRTGRPKLPDSLRKVRVSVTVSPIALRMIDGARGPASRSSYIESLLPHSIEEIRKHTKEQGAIYTPPILSNYIGVKVAEYYTKYLKTRYKRRPNKTLSSLRILDPACGHGELLDATWSALWPTIQNGFHTSRCPTIPDPGQILCAIDIDAGAVSEATDRIHSLGSKLAKGKLKCFQTNALFPYRAASIEEGWKRVSSECATEHGFDIIVTNPPWGAKTDSYRDLLGRGEYTMCKGQYDTADLFIESALNQLRPYGFMAFILPDSLFQRERSPLRELILKNTRVMYIGRLGEKIFENVNRACVILICQKAKATPNHKIDCMRMTPEYRKGILGGELSFSDAEADLSHRVSQSRLLANPGYLFNIDLKDSELRTITLMGSSSFSFGMHLVSSRGIELSKTGDICRCPNCNLWMPIPKSQDPSCGHCGSKFCLEDCQQDSIISSDRKRESSPLIVGENVSRYQSTIDRWVITNRKGISYKSPDIYAGDKIVVRKTGVGISASLDYTGAFTNQVVYMLKTNSNINGSIPLEFILGILNSRAIYYYLVKSHGETEWRSHPYLTQQQILEFPLPPKHRWVCNGTSIVASITRVLRDHLTRGKPLSAKADARVEGLVAKAFGLSKRDYTWIYHTLAEVQQLVPIRALRQVSVDQIFSSYTDG